MAERQNSPYYVHCCAQGKLLRNSVGWEFIVIGLIAGVIGVMVGEVSLWALTTFVFDMQSQWHWPYWLFAPLCGSVMVALLGVWTLENTPHWY